MARRKSGKIKVGVIGCGNISTIYLTQLTSEFKVLEVVAVADLIKSRANAAKKKYKIKRACTVAQMLADKSIDIIVNLTTPDAHFSVAKAAIMAGKSVHNEKPITITRAQGQELLTLAAKKKVLTGGAPDTFLGAGLQTCRKLIDDGWIGKPIGFSAHMLCHGHESWHPDPEFYYKTGAGPMFDMGPYYVTALVSLLGPVKRVAGSTQISIPERVITSKPKFGKKVKVDVPTHVCGLMDFKSGVTGTIVTSFDVWGASHPPIEIYGTEGTLWVPDPNCFGGPVKVIRAGGEAQEVPLTHNYPKDSRGLGVADMAFAIKEGRTNRCNGEMAYHVLDVMHAIHDASDTSRSVKLKSTCKQPTPLAMNPLAGEVD